MSRAPRVSGEAQRYFEAAALGNGRLRRFVELTGGIKFSFLILHFFIIALALNFPVMFSLARLEPYEFYSRLYGTQLAEMLPAEVAPATPEAAGDFNGTLYAGGYGRRVMIPLLAFAFMLILILQLVFYALAALFLGAACMTGSPLAFRTRVGILVLSSTLPALAAALLGLWLPTVHLLVFYLAEIILAFAVLRAREDTREDTREGTAADLT
ncbi:MAG: hypothetical protein LBL56_08205 [Treponema sp.]|nr:hypothetical protein [Treponema sp.]